MKKILFILLLIPTMIFASNGGGKQITFIAPWDSANGVPYTDFKVQTYAAGTTNNETCWSDEDKQNACPNPIIDDGGTCDSTSSDGVIDAAYCDGDYNFKYMDTDSASLFTIANKNVEQGGMLFAGSTTSGVSDTDRCVVTSLPSATSANRNQICVLMDASDNYLGTYMNRNGSSWAKFGGEVFLDPNNYSSTGGKINNAVADCSDETIRIYDVQTLGANLIVPTDCSLDIIEGGSIAKASTYTLTINGGFRVGLYTVFDGFSAGNVQFGTGSIPFIRVEWWGSGADLIQKALDAAGEVAAGSDVGALDSGKKLTIPIKLVPKTTYEFSTKLSIDRHGTVIISDNYPRNMASHFSQNSSSADLDMPILEYTGGAGGGTDYGIEVGLDEAIDQAVTEVFIRSIVLRGFQIKVGQNTDVGLRVWWAIGSEFEKLVVFGNSDKDQAADAEDTNNPGASINNMGVAVQGGILNTFRQIEVYGIGVDNTAGLTKRLGRGFFISTTAGSTMTTTLFEQLHAIECKTGIYLAGNVTLDNITTEASTLQGLFVSVDGNAEINNYWSEERSTAQAYDIQGAAARLVFNTPTFNHGANQVFGHAAGTANITFNQARFISSHANPEIFRHDDFNTAQVRFYQCSFSANTTMTGAADITGGYDQLKIIDMDVVIYRFYVAAVAQSRGEAVMETLGTTGSNHTLYTLPEAGNILGVITTYKGNAYAGTYGIDIFVGAASAIDLDGQTADVNRIENYLEHTFSSGDVLEAKLETDGSFPAGAGDMLVEVIVALGDDGL